MTVWQEDAWHEWRDRLESRLDPRAQALISTMPDRDQLQWIRLLNRASHPVAAGMADWLSQVDTRPWIAAPGDTWDIAEGQALVLVCYPEYLGWDPLAMCAMAALWGGTRRERWEAIARRFGPLPVLGARQGRLTGSGVDGVVASFTKAYRSHLDAWGFTDGTGPGPSTFGADLPWPPVPEYEEYREQLLFGVVPHEVAGRGISTEAAVLLALLGMPDDQRMAMAGLAYKAVEGRWLATAWQEA